MKRPYLLQFILGILLGLIVPSIVFYLFYQFSYTHIAFSQYVKILMLKSMLSKVLALAVIPNLLVFYIYIWKKEDNWARGILFGTMLMAILVMVLYFLY